MSQQETVIAILARNVRRRRDRKKLSQAQLAARCGWTQSRIAEVENGKNIYLDRLDVLAQALDTTPDKLLRTSAAKKVSQSA